MSANDVQIAGSHYQRQEIQAWDYIAANKIGYFEGNIIKYVSRWQNKGGVEDLRKAKHYIEKLIELNGEKSTYDKIHLSRPIDATLFANYTNPKGKE